MSEEIKNTEAVVSWEIENALIGTCTSCGIAVTEANAGETSPKVLCRDCVAKRDAAEKARLAEAERLRSVAASRATFRRTLSHIIGGVIGLAIVIFGLVTALSAPTFDMTLFLIALGAGVFVSTYAITLFYPDSLTRNLFLDLAWGGFKFGFIIELDLDGILWYFAVRALLGILSIIIGILGFFFTVLLGILISPFVYIYLMVKDIRSASRGEFVESF